MLQAHRGEFTAPSTYTNKLQHCKLGAAFDSQQRRFEISTVESLSPVIDVVSQALEKAGFEEKMGVMPPGSLESQLLDLLYGRKGGKGRSGKGGRGGAKGSKR